MSIPPFLSRSPPPICETSDEDDETFGNFMSSELAVDISQGGEILGDYEKKTVVTKCEDTTSEDSGLCMTTVGQNQSPCENSPVSSTYNPSVGLEVLHNCEKSDLIFPAADPLHYEKKFCSKLCNCVEDNKCDVCVSESTCSEIGVQTVRNIDGMETGLLYEVPSVSVVKSENLLHNTFESIQSDTDVSSNSVTQTYDVIRNIPPKEFNPTSFDATFLENIDKFIASESIDFDDFQMFHVDEKLNSPEDGKNCDESLQFSQTMKSINSLNINFENSPENCIDQNFKHSFCDGTPSFININMERKNQENTSEMHGIDSGKIDLSENDYTLHNTDNQTKHLITTKQTNPCHSFCETLESLNDDEFSDFADFQSSTAILLDVEKNLNASVQTSVKAHWTDWWSEYSLPPLLTVQLSDELSKSKIWDNLKQLDGSPALMYQWSSSVSNCKLLSALNIDSRNILLGPRNRYKFSGTDDLSSNSIKKTITGDHSKFIDETVLPKDPVPDAHFDWVGSGLVNPLDSIQDEVEKSESGSSVKVPQPSKIAEEALQNLPNLSFMRKSFIVFPKCVS